MGILRDLVDLGIALPAALEQQRELLKEQWRRDESRKAGLERIAELEAELDALRPKPEAPSIPEPDPGDGFELCAKCDATDYAFRSSRSAPLLTTLSRYLTSKSKARATHS